MSSETGSVTPDIVTQADTAELNLSAGELDKIRTAKMEDRMLDEKISGMTIPEICDTRTSAGYHYADDYRERYQMLISAYRLLKEVSIHRYQSAVKEVIEDYVGGTYLIDTY